MLDIPIYTGVNAPREHQRTIGKLFLGLGNLFTQGQIALEPFPETMINESETSPTPDVMLLDNAQDKIKVIIEVSGTTGFKKDFKKTIELAEEYEVDEGFVYDYKTGNWRKYKLGVGEISENPSFCDAIGYDLGQFVK